GSPQNRREGCGQGWGRAGDEQALAKGADHRLAGERGHDATQGCEESSPPDRAPVVGDAASDESCDSFRHVVGTIGDGQHAGDDEGAGSDESHGRSRPFRSMASRDIPRLHDWRQCWMPRLALPCHCLPVVSDELCCKFRAWYDGAHEMRYLLLDRITQLAPP